MDYKTIKQNLLKDLNAAMSENKAISSLEYNKKSSGEDFALISKAVKNYEVINNKYSSHPYIKIDNYILELNSSKTCEVKEDLQKRFDSNQKRINDINIKLAELKATYDLINKSIRDLYNKIEELAPNTKYYYDIHNFNRYDDRTVKQYEQDERNEAQYNYLWNNFYEDIYKMDKEAYRYCTHQIEEISPNRWAVRMEQFGEVIILIMDKNGIINFKKITKEEEHQTTLKLIHEKNYSFVNKINAILGF
jgi:uncharacterized coiled-coil protein SlyX